MNDGQKLQLLVKKSDLGALGIIEKLKGKISQGKFYKLYKEERIDEPYLTLLNEVGLIINDENYILGKKDVVFSSTPNAGWGTKTIPLIDMDRMNKDLHQYQENPKYVIDQIDLPMLRNTTAAWDVLSDEMYPEYKKGSKVLVRHMPIEDVDFGSIYFIMTENSLIMRKIRKGSKPDKWRLVASNKDYDEREIDIKKVKNIFLVRGCINIDSY